MMPAKPAVVVDTNVPVAANGHTPQASAECAAACRHRLLEIAHGRLRLVLDDGSEIFTEYLSRLSLSGQPGVGDLFMKWISDHQYNPERCERVALTPHPSRAYEQFPDDEELTGFDQDDRKFVAAARASSVRPPVVNAVDSDWWDYEVALVRHGVTVEFLCSDQVAAWRLRRERR